MSKLDFSSINKETKETFHQQKALIKKVMLGKKVNCYHCQQPLSFIAKDTAGHAYIRCQKACTDIELEVEN